MPRSYRIVLAEEHALFRSALRALLERDSEYEVVGEADNGRDAIKAAVTFKPDLVILDISLPGMNGLSAISGIKQRVPEVRIIVVTTQKADDTIHEALRLGAEGYILKDAAYEELRTAVSSVCAGKLFLTPYVSGRVIKGYLDATKSASASQALDVLSQRERQILKLIAEGRTSRNIGEFLSLSAKTVAKHRSNLMRKLNIHCVATLTTFAIENGLTANPTSHVQPAHRAGV
jgi:DNA-binding NarL/FixJ family response regulator